MNRYADGGKFDSFQPIIGKPFKLRDPVARYQASGSSSGLKSEA